MLDVKQAEARAADLVQAACRAGADAADVLYAGDGSTSVRVRLGELEDVQRSEGEEIGLRLFVGTRSASVSSSDLSADALSALVDRALAMAREAPEDPFAGLAPDSLLYRGGSADLESDDEQDPAPGALRDMAREMEDVARAVPGVTNSGGGGLSSGRSIVALATSQGFVRGYTASFYSAGVSVIAGTGSGMQRDHASHQTRHFRDLDSPVELGQRAAERAVRRLDPKQLASAAMPIVFDPRVGNSLVGHLLGAIGGPAVARRTSFLVGKEDEALFPVEIRISEDPHRRRGLRSRPFDGEGVATSARQIVQGGRVTGWLLNSASARQLGLTSTGHAVRGVGGPPGVGATNVQLEPGTLSPEALIADIGSGLYVTELIGQGVNPVTGDYSRGASGFRIENGVITEAVAEITIAGNLLDMFGNLSAANDLEHRRAVDVPTLRVEGMTVAGA